MRPSKRDQGGQQDLLRSRLDQIIDLAHPLAKLARNTEWSFLRSGRVQLIPIFLAVRRADAADTGPRHSQTPVQPLRRVVMRAPTRDPSY